MPVYAYTSLGLLWLTFLCVTPALAQSRCANPAQSVDAKIFLVDECEECNAARLFLLRHRIPFRQFNVRDPGVWQRLLDGPGRGRIPAIHVCGEWFFGFDQDIAQKIRWLFPTLT